MTSPLQHQHLATLLCCILTSVIFLYYLLSWKRKSRAKTRAAAPEPAGAWPVIGHLQMLIKPQLLHVTLGDLADKYGPIFSIRLGLQKAIVVSNWEVARECFTTNDKFFATRPSTAATRIMGYNHAALGLAPYGSYWREVRKLAIIELLSNRRLELLKHVRVSEVKTSIKELYQQWATNTNPNNSRGRVLVDMQTWFGDLTLNLIIKMVAGKRYFGGSAEEDGNEAKQLQKAIEDLLYLLGLFVLSDAIPFLGWLDLHGHHKAMKRTAKEVENVLGRWLEEHKQKRLVSKTKQVDEDFMDVLLSELGDENENFFGHEADSVNKATCLAMISAGTDTTKATLTWALALLLNNPDKLKKAQDEIDNHVGTKRPIEELDIEKLVYLKAIVKETLRLYPAAPLALPHEATKECFVSNYRIQTGTRLIVNLSKIQRDPYIWSNPFDFQPERFLTAHANMDVRGKHFELIPFGAGRRSCPGISFALQEVHLALGSLLQGFDFQTPFDAPVDMVESVGITSIKSNHLEVLISPRLPSDLY